MNIWRRPADLFRRVFWAMLFLCCTGSLVGATGIRIAFIGDSLTAGNSYAVQLETYLRACAGLDNVAARSFGFPGDTSLGLLKHLDDILAYKPDSATLLFGMNDGFYGAYTPWMGENYCAGLNRAIERLKQHGCRQIYLATPTLMDPYYGRPNSIYARKCDAEEYNRTLKKLAEFAEKVAVKQNVTLVELHQRLANVMRQCKERYGEDYVILGRDGIHPTPNGHLVILYSFLEHLGVNGDIASITIDGYGRAEVSAGHRVISYEGGRLLLESRRYPFCHTGETIDILNFVPFQRNFNRFMLRVVDPEPGKYRVYWGGEYREVTAAALASGINLAEEFRVNPFTAAFMNFYELIKNKQRCEVASYFEINPRLNKLAESLPANSDLVEIRRSVRRHLEQVSVADIVLPPVIHSICIEKIGGDE